MAAGLVSCGWLFVRRVCVSVVLLAAYAGRRLLARQHAPRVRAAEVARQLVQSHSNVGQRGRVLRRAAQDLDLLARDRVHPLLDDTPGAREHARRVDEEHLPHGLGVAGASEIDQRLKRAEEGRAAVLQAEPGCGQRAQTASGSGEGPGNGVLEQSQNTQE